MYSSLIIGDRIGTYSEQTFGYGTIGFYFVFMALAWTISGGHFNPAITLGVFFSEMKLGQNLITFLLIWVAQWCGAFFGVFLGWMALCDYKFMDNLAEARGGDVTRKASVYQNWLGVPEPTLPYTVSLD